MYCKNIHDKPEALKQIRVNEKVANFMKQHGIDAKIKSVTDTDIIFTETVQVEGFMQIDGFDDGPRWSPYYNLPLINGHLIRCYYHNGGGSSVYIEGYENSFNSEEENNLWKSEEFLRYQERVHKICQERWTDFLINSNIDYNNIEDSCIAGVSYIKLKKPTTIEVTVASQQSFTIRDITVLNVGNKSNIYVNKQEVTGAMPMSYNININQISLRLDYSVFDYSNMTDSGDNPVLGLNFKSSDGKVEILASDTYSDTPRLRNPRVSIKIGNMEYREGYLCFSNDKDMREHLRGNR